MLRTELYRSQLERWPRSGRHILAQFDHQSVVVYQSYRPTLGLFAARNQYFGGEYKLSRMSWIKPNFLWMMYRCGWGTKPDQEITLAVTIRREAFDQILAQAVHSSYPGNTIYGTHAEWQNRVKNSNVRLQWDPDHDPHGNKQNRRAIQLGLSGDVLKSYSRNWIIDIQDISSLVAEGRNLVEQGRLSELMLPSEHVYPVTNEQVAIHLEIDPFEASGAAKLS